MNNNSIEQDNTKQYDRIKYYQCDLPIVGIWDTGKESSEKRSKRQVFPTEESPIIISLSK